MPGQRVVDPVDERFGAGAPVAENDDTVPGEQGAQADAVAVQEEMPQPLTGATPIPVQMGNLADFQVKETPFLPHGGAQRPVGSFMGLKIGGEETIRICPHLGQGNGTAHIKIVACLGLFNKIVGLFYIGEGVERLQQPVAGEGLLHHRLLFAPGAQRGDAAMCIGEGRAGGGKMPPAVRNP